MNEQLKTAYSNLCCKDPRHPDYYDFYGQEIEEEIADGYTPEIPTPREGCYCDNCFNGRDSLALIIIGLIEPTNG